MGNTWLGYYYIKRKYSSKEELTKKIYEYFEQIKDTETPNQASLRLFLGITKYDVYHWKNSGKEDKGLGDRTGQDLYEALMIAYELLESAAWNDLGARGEWGKFYLARICGHIEKQKIISDNVQRVVMPTVKIGDKPLTFDCGEEPQGAQEDDANA